MTKPFLKLATLATLLTGLTSQASKLNCWHDDGTQSPDHLFSISKVDRNSDQVQLGLSMNGLSGTKLAEKIPDQLLQNLNRKIQLQRLPEVLIVKPSGESSKETYRPVYDFMGFSTYKDSGGVEHYLSLALRVSNGRGTLTEDAGTLLLVWGTEDKVRYADLDSQNGYSENYRRRPLLCRFQAE